jgi:hypothetical protein
VALYTSPDRRNCKRHERRQHEGCEDDAADQPDKVDWVDPG